MQHVSVIRILLCLTFCACLANRIEALDKVRLNKNGHFVDALGRVLLFHGFNSVKKSPPWYEEQMLNRTQLQMFQSWGINVVRLGVMWAGVMPTKDTIDRNYLLRIDEIIQACEEHGIYVFLDMHQDVLSTRFGTYDGIPAWLVDELPKPDRSRAYPWPFSKAPEQWFENYLTYACVECAEQLYTNASGTWSHWGKFWETVADAFRNRSNVLGYELLNEPPMTNFYRNPMNLLPGYVGHHYLLPTYDYLVSRIRSVDPDTLIFYEPLTYGVFMPNSILDTGTGFDRVPGSLTDPQAAQKSVLSYHYYCWLLQTADPALDMSWWKKFMCDDMLMPRVFANSRQSIKRTGGAMFLTEFGICGPDGNPHSVNTIECDAVMRKADAEFQSWTYWDGNFLDSQGNPIETQIKYFIRPYPKTTQGTPEHLRFDPTTGEFYYAFHVDGSTVTASEALSTIFVPTGVHYPNGTKIHVTPESVQSVLEGDELKLLAEPFSERIQVVVKISRL